MSHLVDIKNLHVSFQQDYEWIKVVRGVELSLEKGEILGLIGESGSGKSVTASSLMKLIDPEIGLVEADQITFDDLDVLHMNEDELSRLRGKRVAYVFQNPVEALNPNIKIGQQFVELISFHEGKGSLKTNLRGRIMELLTDVNLDEPESIMNRYPRQLSGGQAQRIVIAMALALKPDLIIADEPTSSIDASLRGHVVELLKSINQKYQIAMLIITHDFEVAHDLCDNIMVMYGGLVVETGKTTSIFKRPLHPYTLELMKCVHALRNRKHVLYTLEGAPLEPHNFSEACPFYERCPMVQGKCSEMPNMSVVDAGTYSKVRCHFPVESAYQVDGRGLVV